MSTEISPSLSQPKPTIKIWAPNTIGFITFFLGFPNGIILAAINWIRMGMKGKAFANIAGGIVGILIVIVVPDNFGWLVGLVINLAYGAYLRQQMKNDIEKITKTNVQYSHWLYGLLISIATIVIIVIVAVVAIEIQTFIEGLSPSSALYYANRGDEYFENGNYDLAIAEYTQAIELEPNSRALYYCRGLAYHQKGDFENAVDDFSFVLTLPPSAVVDDADVYYARGQVYADDGKYELAIADFTQFIQIQPNDVFGYTNRGTVYEYLGQTEEAIKDFEQALELTEDSGLRQAIENELIKLRGK